MTVEVANGEPITTDPAPGSSQQAGSGDADSKLRLRLSALESEAVSLREKESDRKRKETDKIKKAADKAAVEKGDASKVIEELQAKVAAQESVVEAFNRSTDDRINGKLEKLPEDVRAEITFVRDGMSRDKLESFIDMKFKGQQQVQSMEAGVPSPSATTGSRRRDDDPLDQGTKELLDTLMANETVYEIGRQIGHFTIGAGRTDDGPVRGQAGDEKFRFMATGEDDEDTRRFIRLVKATSVDPFREQRKQQLERVKALRNVIK